MEEAADGILSLEVSVGLKARLVDLEKRRSEGVLSLEVPVGLEARLVDLEERLLGFP